MTDKFIKWLCEKAGEKYIACNRPDTYCNYSENSLECLEEDCFEKDETDILLILIKAMWAINREESFKLQIEFNRILISGMYNGSSYFKEFLYKDYNSEQQALEKALEYIYKQDKT